MAEIGIAVFGPDRPIVGDGICETAAGSPAGAGAGIVEDTPAKAGRIIEVRYAGESNTAGAIEKNAVKGDAKAAADRTLYVRTGAEVGLEESRNSRNVLGRAHARAV